ncbi:MAG: hypothetical protein L0Y67_00535 [Gammaproteobacteria bacterium]|nr:hypothetical protein [Gammaproteobacteria bacterium]MCI0590091.1 hypothetical protein [Gammaproteobacteria bacterium]
MSTTKTLTGFAIAAAAAGFFALAPLSQAMAAENGAVHCYGVNACKGKSECKTATNACKGQNSCKGHGVVSAPSKEECEKLGGNVGK